MSALERRVVDDLGPPLEGRSLLDAGCGTGRRLITARAAGARAFGVDLTPEMLAARPARDLALAAADVRALPFRAGLFDVLWCRLVLGHVADLAAAYRELGRVAAERSALVVSDFHPRAAAAGHRRTFHDTQGRLREVVHHTHAIEDHARAAAAAGWTMRRAIEAPADEPERAYFERAGRIDRFERDRDLPLVLALGFER